MFTGKEVLSRNKKVLIRSLILIGTIFLAGNGRSQPNTIWTLNYHGGDDYGMSATSDLSSNIIVAGASKTEILYDYFVIKYAPDGDTLWTRRYDTGGFARGVAADSDTNIIVTGYSYNGVNLDYLTYKLSPTGETLWSRRYDDGMASAHSVATDPGNNVIVTGTSDADWLTIKYDEVGDILWTRRYDSGDQDDAWDIDTDGDSNIVVVGQVFNGVDFDIRLVKYAPDGDTLWTRITDLGMNDEGNCVAVDNMNNIIISGSYQNTPPDALSLYVIKYNPVGDTVWTRTYDSGLEDEALGITTDGNANIIIHGYSNQDGANYNYLTLKYSPDGGMLWTKGFDGGFDDWGSDVACDESGDVIVTGWSFNGSDNDFVTLKYTGPTGVGDDSAVEIADLPLSPTLIGNYPNPFNATTTIGFSLSQMTIVDLSIYNIRGELVRRLVEEEMEVGNHTVVWDGKNEYGSDVGSGIYLSILSASDNRRDSRKMVLSR